MATKTRGRRKSKGLNTNIKILIYIGAGAAIVLLVFLFMNTYYKDNYATKKYVVEALEGYQGEMSDADMNAITSKLTKELNHSMDSMDMTELTDEQLKTLLTQVQNYLSSDFTNMAKEELTNLAGDIVKLAVADKLKENQTLIKQYQNQIDTLTAQTKELTKTLESAQTYSYNDIYDIAKSYGMSEEDVKAFLQAYQTQNSSQLQALADKLNTNISTITALISSNKSSNSSEISELAKTLETDEASLKSLINNYNTTLVSKISSLQTYTTEQLSEIASALGVSEAEMVALVDQLKDELPVYEYSTDANGKTSVKVTIPSSKNN